jgi:hypothetical protein
MSETPDVSTGPSPRTYRQVVFVTALCCLMFELILARLADYHLGADNTFLALPIAFLGLALGSLHMHLRPSAIERFRLARELTILAVVSVGGLLFALVFFSWIMPVTSTLGMMDRLDYLARKTAFFIVLMTTPFYVFGRILTGIYQLRREDIGAIYAADFIGAGLACALTPIAFHFGGLPFVVLPLTLVAFTPLVLISAPGRKRQIVAVVGVIVTIAAVRFVDWADNNGSYAEYREGQVVRELEHAWNEHSRVALIERQGVRKDGSKGKRTYKIIHNNSRSNVRVSPYRGERKTPKEPKRIESMEAPWVLGREPDSILVMFAGAGSQMIMFDEYAGSKANITGVELNGLVETIARRNETIAHMRIHEFLSRENIDLVIDEGRHFMATRPEGTEYDVIYLGCNAATTAITGHSRKYLDTVEALHRYFDLLGDDGLFIVDHQPLDRHFNNLRRVFEERGLGPLEDKIIVLDSAQGDDDLIVAPNGFSKDELERVKAFAQKRYKKKWDRHIRLLPGEPNRHGGKYRKMLDEGFERAITDDRPFTATLDLDGYSLIPEADKKKTFSWYISWIKITTVVVLSTIALLFVVAASVRRESRAPAPVLIYLLATGFCFMLSEVTLMAKVELFLAEPLLSMAAVLSLFLLTSGVGSMLYPRISHVCDTRWLALLAAVLAPTCVFMLDFLVAHALGLDVWLKLVLSAIVIAPLGMALGLFFPHIISCLLANKREQTVSISYGISTLSSVVGSAYALTIMINVGFKGLIYQAAGVYLGLFAFAQIYKWFGGRWLSR